MRFLLRVSAIAPLSLPLPLLADAPQDFSGEWVATTNNSSDTPANASTPGTSHGGARGAGGHGHGMGGHAAGGGRHSRQGSDAGTGDSDKASAAPADSRLHARILIIRQSEVVFDVAADGQRVAYRFDNRGNYGSQYGGTVDLTWSTPDMVVETHPDGGGSVEEHYRLSADGRKLTLQLRLQRAGEDTAREITREFVRSDSTAASAANSPTPP